MSRPKKKVVHKSIKGKNLTALRKTKPKEQPAKVEAKEMKKQRLRTASA